MNTYKTSEIAEYNDIHPNTVRLYEKLALIPKAKRKPNGYRIFTDFHMEQTRLVRTALKIEVLQNGLRKTVIEIVKASAAGNFDRAILLTESCLEKIKREQQNAEEALVIADRLLSGGELEADDTLLTRQQAAHRLQISIDALRNWEMNGLLTIKRKQNGYRVYTNEDLQRLTIIRSLRCANYSLAAILRMLQAFSDNPRTDLRAAIDTPEEGEDIVSACDKLLTSLQQAEKISYIMLSRLREMRERFSTNPPL
ncbi:MerR family transcriptional regulator [Paenibacillus aceti]|uniref:MerR family transcriptional regulator n=1 Tax=Paenibacillus aceti TaxID=1820010 RepID=A0ABQ1W9W2_9BACL|nr:MerR family transcriptional regulator [Paenibacillus aceti]GGG20123.1 MerR family transcriptional regulator [Paenibacillus aceti]